MEIEKAKSLSHALRKNIGEVIKGQESVLDLMVMTIMAQGHILLESVPGEGKTLAASALAASISGVSIGRISGQPTLKPNDLTGAEIPEEHGGKFRLVKGPIFNHIVLFDELNRTDPRTQSALLEAMQELKVTIGEQSHLLPTPFHVIATQNPLSHEGTWELDAAAKHRFMVKIHWGFPDKEVEYQIVEEASAVLQDNLKKIHPVLTREELNDIQSVVQESIELPSYIIHLLNSITVATRRTDPSYPADALESDGLGGDVISDMGGVASRVSTYWPSLLRAHALYHGRRSVSAADVFATAVPMLNHRIETNYPVNMERLIGTILRERGQVYAWT
jgi:MoxR-like ATPase